MGPLADERALEAGDLLRAWLAEPDRGAARTRFLALKDAWQYLGEVHRATLLDEAHEDLEAGRPPDARLKEAALELLPDEAH